jgi:hypothetical protein
MEHLLEKLSSYHIFNNLLPGVIFVVLAEVVTDYSFVQDNLLVGVFVYYFIGMVISRIGSLIIEPILRFVSFLDYTSYADYLQALEQDKTIEILSEVNNTYRTLCSMAIFLIFLKFYECFEQIVTPLQGEGTYVLLWALTIIFLFSYRKQTSYITNRIKYKK